MLSIYSQNSIQFVLGALIIAYYTKLGNCLVRSDKTAYRSSLHEFWTPYENGSFARASPSFRDQCGLVPGYDWSKSGAGAYCPADTFLKPETTEEKEVALGQFPSLVFVTAAKGGDIKSCSAVIISPYMVIGSYRCLAHKFEGDNAGASQLIAGAASGQYQNAQGQFAKAFCRVRLTDPGKPLGVELAIIQLREPFKFNKFVQPACLAIDNPIKDQGHCYAIRNRLRAPSEPQSLIQTYVPLKPTYECSKLFGSDSQTKCFSAPFNRGNGCFSPDGAPVYCIDRCNGVTKQWVAGMDILSWLSSNEEQIAVAIFNKIQKPLNYHLDKCWTGPKR